MEKQQADILFKKYREGTASAEEINSLLSWVQQIGETEVPQFTAAQLEQVEQEIAAELRISRKQSGLVVKWTRVAAAAAVVLLVLSGGYFASKWNSADRRQEASIVKAEENDVAPAEDRATLTLGDGRKVVLTKDLNGEIAREAGVGVRVDGASSLAYKSDKENTATEAGMVYNTLSTGRGEHAPFPLVLEDGTKVWLNSASSLVYPTAFSDGPREVTLTGEAYFEVMHNSRKPFRVKSGNQVVEDIGTSFNINSYTDESAIKTTLVEGAAKVKSNNMEKMLGPGDQATTSSQNMTVAKSDVETEIAWMKGKFVFRDEELHSVMRQLSRWYNIDVEYEYNPRQVVLGGGFSKNRSMSQVLKALEETGAVKFRIRGNKVIVTK